jgi:3-deoxy-D-manno-octulosonate 8-phosphate phosphatase KdsC-like HAD superfamily phosphatase
VLYKTYNSKDFSAINEIKKNFKLVFLSDDNDISYNMCRRRNIPFYFAKNEKEKVSKLGEILRRYGATPDETIYIGSKISDVPCCKMIPKSMCPEDAGQYLKDICWAEFTTKGGKGIMPELLYLLKYCGDNGEIC